MHNICKKRSGWFLIRINKLWKVVLIRAHAQTLKSSGSPQQVSLYYKADCTLNRQATKKTWVEKYFTLLKKQKLVWPLEFISCITLFDTCMFSVQSALEKVKWIWINLMNISSKPVSSQCVYDYPCCIFYCLFCSFFQTELFNIPFFKHNYLLKTLIIHSKYFNMI